MSYQRKFREEDSPRGSGFILLLLLLFVVSGIFRSTTSEERAETIKARSALLINADGIRERFFHLSDSLQAVASEKGEEYSCEDFVQARNLLFALSDSVTQLSANGMPPSTISFLLEKAEANSMKQQKPIGFEMSRAEEKYGPPISVRDAQVTWAGTVHFFSAVAVHVIWFGVFFVPFLLVARVLLARRFSAASFAWVFKHPIWLATCSFFWLFACLKYGESEPRVTAKFFLLRFLYMWNQRKVFLSVAEKEALFASAGESRVNAERAFAYVAQQLATATDAGKRLAIISFIAAFLPTFQLAGPVLAQDSTVVQQDTTKPSLLASGFVISSLNGSADTLGVSFDYFRATLAYNQGPVHAMTQLNPLASQQMKFGFVGYDMPELAGGFDLTVQGGKVIAPWCWAYVPPNVSEFQRAPFDGQLDIPFFDPGIVVFAQHKRVPWLSSQFALLNGSGEMKDDNGSMDVSSRLTAKFESGSASVAYQRGMQPDGMREAIVCDASYTQGPITLWVMGMERPDIQGNGFATSVIARAGPYAFVGQYENSLAHGDRFEMLEAGVNRLFDGNTSLRLHVVGKTASKPRLELSIRQIF